MLSIFLLSRDLRVNWLILLPFPSSSSISSFRLSPSVSTIWTALWRRHSGSSLSGTFQSWNWHFNPFLSTILFSLFTNLSKSKLFFFCHWLLSLQWDSSSLHKSIGESTAERIPLRESNHPSEQIIEHSFPSTTISGLFWFNPYQSQYPWQKSLFYFWHCG